MGEVRIRPARNDEADLLGALKLRSSLASGERTEEIRALPEAGRIPHEHLPFVFVAEVQGEVVGFATVLPGRSFTAELEDLFVDPEAWRKGIGSRLIAEAERRAVVFGARSLQVVANEQAQAFYERRGFRKEREVMTSLARAPEMLKHLP